LRGVHALAVLALVIAHAAGAANPNLLPNGDFSQQNQLAGWTCLSGSWISDDAASNAASGSMWLQNFGNSPGHCTSSCIAVKPGVAYTLGGQSRILFGNPVITFACAEADTDHCNSFTYNLQGPAMSTANTWNSQPATASGILHSYSLMCTVTLGSQDLGSISGHFDNLFLTTDVIFFDGLEIP
jgi:hypothetical protein